MLAGSGVVISGVVLSAIAGAFTFGIGAVVGCSITAGVCGTVAVGTGVITHVIAVNYGKAQSNFQSMSSHFRSLGSTSRKLKEEVIKLHAIVGKYKRNHDMIGRTDKS